MSEAGVLGTSRQAGWCVVLAIGWLHSRIFNTLERAMSTRGGGRLWAPQRERTHAASTPTRQPAAAVQAHFGILCFCVQPHKAGSTHKLTLTAAAKLHTAEALARRTASITLLLLSLHTCLPFPTPHHTHC
jgi:hypothetical protein